ncbi:hypothetical protein C8Q74DRAFT_1235631 [Fomes fomentarius]|nr:hypothetical protein C8Q74DRAFT_1235631 [Fomes fomentarius]
MGWPACLLAFYASATRPSFPTIVDAHPICSSELLFAYFIASFSVCLALSVIAHVVDVGLTGVPDYHAVLSSKVVRKARFAFDCLWTALRFVYGCSSRIVLASLVFLLPFLKTTSKNLIPVARHVVCMVSRSVVLHLAVKLATFLARTVIIWAATLSLDAVSTTVWGLGSCALWIGELFWVHRVALASTVVRLVWASVAGIYQIFSEEIHQAFRRLCQHRTHYHITHPSASPSTSTSATTTVALRPRDLQVTAMMRARATYRVLQRLVSVCAYYRNTIRPVSSTIRLRILVEHYSQLHVTVLVAGAVHSSFIITEDAYIFTRSDRTPVLDVLDVGRHAQDEVHISPDWSSVSPGPNMSDSTDSDARVPSYSSVLRSLAERKRNADDPALLDPDIKLPRDLGVSRTDAYTPLVSLRASAPTLFDLPGSTPGFSSTSAYKPTPDRLLLPSGRPCSAAVLSPAGANSDLDTDDFYVSQSTATARPALVLPSSSVSPLASSSLDLAPSFTSLKLPVSLATRSNSWSVLSDPKSPDPANARVEEEDIDPCSSPQSDPEENDAAADGRKARRGKRLPTTVRQWRKRERRRLARAETEVELERARVEYHSSEVADDWESMGPDGEREGFSQTAATSVC